MDEEDAYLNQLIYAVLTEELTEKRTALIAEVVIPLITENESRFKEDSFCTAESSVVRAIHKPGVLPSWKKELPAESRMNADEACHGWDPLAVGDQVRYGALYARAVAPLRELAKHERRKSTSKPSIIKGPEWDEEAEQSTISPSSIFMMS